MDKSQCNQGYSIIRGGKENIPDTGTLFLKAAGKSDGVPFQLIFGQQIGEGIYLNTGDGVRKLLGIAPGDLTEKMFQDMIEEIIPLSDDVPADRILSRNKFISGDIPSYMAEVLIRLPGGEKKWILDTSVPLFDNDTGKVIGAMGVLYDDNSRRTILEKLVEAKYKAEEIDRLKAAFLHNISHEIRTPLNAIVGFSTLLEEYPESPEKRREYLDIISRSSDHLLEIIDNIVEISKIEAGTIKLCRGNVAIGNLIQNIYRQYSFQASEKDLHFTFSITPEDEGLLIYTDSYKLSQVLKNLVNNAIKFTSEGKVEFGCKHKDTYIEFFVTDTGIGIPAEHQANIFIRFFQGDNSPRRSYGGTGLGLAISKAYVELLGGKIWFTSQPGKGSTFSFIIPSNIGEK